MDVTLIPVRLRPCLKGSLPATLCHLFTEEPVLISLVICPGSLARFPDPPLPHAECLLPYSGQLSLKPTLKKHTKPTEEANSTGHSGRKGRLWSPEASQLGTGNAMQGQDGA